MPSCPAAWTHRSNGQWLATWKSTPSGLVPRSATNTSRALPSKTPPASRELASSNVAPPLPPVEVAPPLPVVVVVPVVPVVPAVPVVLGRPPSPEAPPSLPRSSSVISPMHPSSIAGKRTMSHPLEGRDTHFYVGRRGVRSPNRFRC